MIDPELELKELDELGLSLRVEKDGEIICESRDAMLKPLFACLARQREHMRGAVVIDKVVGRAAALLMILARVGQVITPVASESAKKLLDAAGIPLFAHKIIPVIMNRDRTDLCPMEKMANEFDSPEEFYQKLATIIRLE